MCSCLFVVGGTKRQRGRPRRHVDHHEVPGMKIEADEAPPPGPDDTCDDDGDDIDSLIHSFSDTLDIARQLNDVRRHPVCSKVYSHVGQRVSVADKLSHIIREILDEQSVFRELAKEGNIARTMTNAYDGVDNDEDDDGEEDNKATAETDSHATVVAVAHAVHDETAPPSADA